MTAALVHYGKVHSTLWRQPRVWAFYLETIYIPGHMITTTWKNLGYTEYRGTYCKDVGVAPRISDFSPKRVFIYTSPRITSDCKHLPETTAHRYRNLRALAQVLVQNHEHPGRSDQVWLPSKDVQLDGWRETLISTVSNHRQ